MSYVAVSPGSAPPTGLGASPPPAEKSNLPMIAGGLALLGAVAFFLRRKAA